MITQPERYENYKKWAIEWMEENKQHEALDKPYKPGVEYAPYFVFEVVRGLKDYRNLFQKVAVHPQIGFIMQPYGNITTPTDRIPDYMEFVDLGEKAYWPIKGRDRDIITIPYFISYKVIKNLIIDSGLCYKILNDAELSSAKSLYMGLLNKKDREQYRKNNGKFGNCYSYY